MRRLHVNVLLLSLLALSSLASRSDAQERRAAPPPAAPTKKPQVAHAAIPPDPAPPQRAPVFVGTPTVLYTPDGYIVSYPQYLVLNDGSVLVSFGNGYERVLRQCGAQQQPTPTDPWARDALGRIPAPPGIAALQAGSRGQALGVTPQRTQSACYRVDGSGRPMVATQ